jgi:hypothetical protein
MIYGFLIASVLINIFLIWYVIQLVKRLLIVQDNLDELLEKLTEYEEHVEIVYNMETFYGDETLKNLLRHSKGISAECKKFKLLYDDEENLEEEYEEHEEEREEGHKEDGT